MATFSEQTDLIVETVRDYRDLAESSYNVARQSLDTLKSAVEDLPLSVVNPDIGATLNIDWTATITPVAAPDEPTWVQDIIDDLPPPPTVPDVEAYIPPFTESAPTVLTGSVGTPGDPSIDTFPVIGTLGTTPEITADIPTTPTLGSVSSITATAPTVGSPGTISAVAVSVPTISGLGVVPTIGAVEPTIDLAVLDTEFDWTEPTYTGEISTNLEAALLNVIGGNPVLAQAYWDARLSALQADITLEKTGRLRKASNAGAASYLPLPSEARLAATADINDEATRATQKARLEVFLEQTRQAREDFWEAVKTGLAYEQMWVGYHDHVAQRSLAAAEQLTKLAVEVYNAQAGRFNLLVENAKLALAIDQADVARTLDSQRLTLAGSEQEINAKRLELEAEKAQADVDLQTERLALDYTGREIDAATLTLNIQNTTAQRDLAAAKLSLELFGQELSAAELLTKIDQAKLARVLQSYELNLKETAQKLDQIKTQLAAHQAEWETKIGAFNADTTRGQQSIQRFGELVKVWSTEVDAELKSKQFPLTKAEIEAKVFETNYSAINAAANATKAIMDSRVGVKKLVLESETAEIDYEAKKNQIEVAVGQLDQAAQEALAKIDVAQAQWVEGQSNALSTRISELAFGWAQAAVSASHVNLGTSTGMDISQSIRADQNAPLEWTWVWG